jgi:hypothetical protein
VEEGQKVVGNALPGLPRKGVGSVAQSACCQGCPCARGVQPVGTWETKKTDNGLPDGLKQQPHPISWRSGGV